MGLFIVNQPLQGTTIYGNIYIYTYTCTHSIFNPVEDGTPHLVLFFLWLSTRYSSKMGRNSSDRVLLHPGGGIAIFWYPALFPSCWTNLFPYSHVDPECPISGNPRFSNTPLPHSQVNPNLPTIYIYIIIWNYILYMYVYIYIYLYHVYVYIYIYWYHVYVYIYI